MLFIFQAELIKQKLEESKNGIKIEIDRFSAKWNELKPSKEYLLSNSSAIEVENYYGLINSLKEEWINIKGSILQLRFV